MRSSIVNMGLWGRIPACAWVITLGICDNNQMATLVTLWKANIKVCFVHQQLFRRRSANLFCRRSGAFIRMHIGTIRFQQFAFVFSGSPARWGTKQVVCDTRDPPADVRLGGDSPWVCRIIGISPSPQAGSVNNEAIWEFNWLANDRVIM